MKISAATAPAILLVALCLGGATLSTHSQRLHTFHYENVLGTSLELKIAAASLEDAEAAEAAALAEIDRQTKILSAWDSGSEFSRWMKTPVQPDAVSAHWLPAHQLFDTARGRTRG